MPSHPHRETSVRQVQVFVLTVSDTRDPATDESGRILREGLEGAGHRLLGHAIVRDEPAAAAAEIQKAIRMGAQGIVVNGGTGITPRDSTFEAVDRLLSKRLPGFGEIFRALSYEEIGARAILSRATAGVVDGALVFLLPGSAKAVRLGMEKLILPVLGHAVDELFRGR